MTPTSCINFMQFKMNAQNNCAAWCVVCNIKTQNTSAQRLQENNA